MSTLRDFKREMDKATSIILEGTDETIRNTSSKLLQSIISNTPVKTGQLRGNWETTLDAEGTKDLKGTLDPSGFNTIGKTEQVLAGYSSQKGTGDIYMTNNLDYANSIEYGQRSQQAPYGMVRINIAKFKSIIETEAKKSKV